MSTLSVLILSHIFILTSFIDVHITNYFFLHHYLCIRTEILTCVHLKTYENTWL